MFSGVFSPDRPALVSELGGELGGLAAFVVDPGERGASVGPVAVDKVRSPPFGLFGAVPGVSVERGRLSAGSRPSDGLPLSPLDGVVTVLA